MNEDDSIDPPDKLHKKHSKNQVKILGPVANLEEHVRPDWWRTIFNEFYLKTDGDVVADKEITKKEISLFLNILKLSHQDKILDVCCGQGRHCLELATRGFQNVEGLDRSSYLIQRAKNQAKKENLALKFREGDARKLPYPSDSFDVVFMLGNSFGYFETIRDDIRILKELFRVLKPHGKILIDVADGNYLKTNFQPRSWEWIDKKHFVCRERSLSADTNRLISREVITHTEKGVVADQFYAERLYSKKTLEHLMKLVGFKDFNFHGAMATESQRNQDLGMMEKRIILTALTRKNWTVTQKKPNEILKEVVVILGDPNRPDTIKPSSKFDEDDFYTIDKLKASLKELPGYHFTYLNNHATLLQDLTRMKEKVDFVFNVCDEGFNNDPRKELHVPALLEQLRIPYSGAGPQCLAYCYDKSLVRGIAKEMEIPVPKAFFIKPEDTTFKLPFSFPAIVKPNFGDSSFGITQRSVANTVEELTNAISEIRERFGYDKSILVEEFLPGKDISVGIIGNPPDSYSILPLTEEDYSSLPDGMPKICGYEAKWLSDSPYWNIKSIPADLPENTKNVIIEMCLKLSERLECQDYTRLDWRLDSEGKPRLLEVNPNPGWCWDGHLAKMAKHQGMSYKDMLQSILQATEQRLKIGEKKEETIISFVNTVKR